MDREKYSTLVEAFKAVPDPRQARGRRYRWDVLLSLIAAALASGQLHARAMGQWVREHGECLLAYLPITCDSVPSEATIRRTLRCVEVTHLEAILGELEMPVPQAQSAPEKAPASAIQALAVDGKRVRGVSRCGAALQLVSVVRHHSGQVVAQAAVAPHSSEQAQVPALLASCELRDTVITLDALHTDRTLAAQIVAQGGHYLLRVKGNQPTLLADIALVWESPPWQGAEHAQEMQQHCTVEKGHGRLERRVLSSSTALNDYLDWPAVQQVLRRQVRRICLKTGELREETSYAITSLPRSLADAAQVEALWRGHWTIENRLHYVRDVTFAEDACRLRTGNAPHALAALRNAVVALFRAEGWRFIPDALRHYGASPLRALRLIGVPL